MKIRLISALVALGILIPLLCIGRMPFAIGIGILSVLGYKEVLDLKKSHKEIPNLVKVLGLVCIVYLVLGDYQLSSLNLVMSYPRMLLPIVLLLIPTVFYENDKYSTKDSFYLLGTIYLVGLFFNLIISFRNIDLNILLYLLAITFLTDTFAYLIGCLIGKHKMCPKISPKKSWEGAIAGLIGGSTIAIIIYTNLIGEFSLKVVLVTVILSIVGQIGDLVYSKIKRENEIKDFSNIMPGHGGILDRIDSLSFIVFTYVILLWFI